MEAFFASIATVALAEIGDKTQLLAIVLAARFRRPWEILAGILIATLANHFIAALAGSLVANLLEGTWFRYAVGLSFIAMAVWTLVPDKLDEGETHTSTSGSIFFTTLIAFFLVEIGDKTQVATIALGAHYQQVFMITVGTTIGMLIANAPAVWLGNRILMNIPLKAIRYAASGLFVLLGVWVLKAA